jgi:hypothetical protein
MTHIAIQEALEGKNVNWLQKITDEEYLSGPQRQNEKLCFWSSKSSFTTIGAILN